MWRERQLHLAGSLGVPASDAMDSTASGGSGGGKDDVGSMHRCRVDSDTRAEVASSASALGQTAAEASVELASVSGRSPARRPLTKSRPFWEIEKERKQRQRDAAHAAAGGVVDVDVVHDADAGGAQAPAMNEATNAAGSGKEPPVDALLCA